MPARVDVWDATAGAVVAMFSCDAAEAVKNDPQRYSLDIPHDAPPSPPSRESDMPFDLLNGKSTKAPDHDRIIRRRSPISRTCRSRG